MRSSFGLLHRALSTRVLFLQDPMSMPVQLSTQHSEEKENGLGGRMEYSEGSRDCESPVKKHKGIHLPSSKGVMVSRY